MQNLPTVQWHMVVQCVRVPSRMVPEVQKTALAMEWSATPFSVKQWGRIRIQWRGGKQRLKDDTTSVQSQDVTRTFEEVQKTNQLLMRLIDHMKKAEHCVEAIEDKLATSISSSSTAKTSWKKAVSPVVRICPLALYFSSCGYSPFLLKKISGGRGLYVEYINYVCVWGVYVE